MKKFWNDPVQSVVAVGTALLAIATLVLAWDTHRIAGDSRVAQLPVITATIVGGNRDGKLFLKNAGNLPALRFREVCMRVSENHPVPEVRIRSGEKYSGPHRLFEAMARDDVDSFPILGCSVPHEDDGTSPIAYVYIYYRYNAEGAGETKRTALWQWEANSGSFAEIAVPATFAPLAEWGDAMTNY